MAMLLPVAKKSLGNSIRKLNVRDVHVATELTVITMMVKGLEMLNVNILNGLIVIVTAVALSWFKHTHLIIKKR